MTLQIIVSLVLTAVISYTLIDAGILHGNYKRFWSLTRQLRPVMFLTNLPVQILTIATGAFLNYGVGLKWGWTSFLHADGSTSNINMIGFDYVWFAPVFAALIILAMPHLTQFEEQLFRTGTKGIRSAIIRSIVFGLIHMTAGISLGFALALTVAGLWFSYQYKKGGIVRSSAYHLAWNYLFIAILLALLVARLF